MSTSGTTERDGFAAVNRRDAERFITLGYTVILSVFGGGLLWAYQTEISGAVIAPGIVVVESNVKKIQHPSGGVVAAIEVSNGMVVKEGDLLLRLDETVDLANLELINKKLNDLVLREVRLKAELSGADNFEMAILSFGAEDEASVRARFEDERAFFESRQHLLQADKERLATQLDQLRNEIEGLQLQITAKRTELDVVNGELRSMVELEAQQLVTNSRTNQLKRDATRLNGEVGSLVSTVAQAKAKIAELEVEALRLGEDFKSRAIEELRDNRAQQAELLERRRAALDTLKRVEIRAPQAGTIHDLSVHTIGGVIAAGEQLMLLVPQGDRLVIDARISPQDIETVHNGDSTAIVRLSAFDHNSTPELNGRLIEVSADATVDQASRAAFYSVRVSLPPSELAKIGGKQLLPGMPADVFIKTSDRTVLSYLAKPIVDQFNRAFRER